MRATDPGRYDGGEGSRLDLEQIRTGYMVI